ncbi:MAG TPA: phenylalanine--tRNA ligase beta subunit-related protein, partial [Candidatus Bathyarchaeia archaeon]|nr:phenylalanine--tRNA ligase beta subunit-related protein [Candidatus Bathyarchaeia archaeon]
MKLLLSWIGTHITSWHQPPVSDIVARFNATVAEIEQLIAITRNVDVWHAGVVERVHETVSVVFPGHKKTGELPHRADVEIGDTVLAIEDKGALRWLTMRDAGSVKEHLFPAVAIQPDELKTGEWKRIIAPIDYVLDIENKSITHRPDLWSHRGVAREIAALFQQTLVPIDALLKPISKSDEDGKGDMRGAAVTDTRCSVLAAAQMTSPAFCPSIVSVACMLSALDIRPISTWVDLTNMVMVDLGHPMHAFDATVFEGETIMVRAGHNGEKLELLDGETVTLTA